MKGVEQFIVGLNEAFKSNMPNKIHIILAGNASRSKWAAQIFDPEKEIFRDVFRKFIPESDVNIIIHPPLNADSDNIYRPTAKTGIALGLLDLANGGVITVIEKIFMHFLVSNLITLSDVLD